MEDNYRITEIQKMVDRIKAAIKKELCGVGCNVTIKAKEFEINFEV